MEVQIVPSDLFLHLCGISRNSAGAHEEISLESHGSFVFFSFGQHPFLLSAKPLSSLPPLIIAARQLREDRRCDGDGTAFSSASDGWHSE